MQNFKAQLCLLSALSMMASASLAEVTGESIAELSNTETISINGTRTDRQINEIAAHVSRVSQQDIDAMASTNIRDILRYEPGVSVEGNGRFGLTGFNIRGINGDRVLILLDNVPIADAFSFGPNLNAGRDFVDIDLIQSVDIVRGPASTLYGSDAIGGVVAFQSKSPEQLLDGLGNAYNRVKLGFDSQSNQRNLSYVHANKIKQFQWLVNIGLRDGQAIKRHNTEDETLGPQRESANPQQNDSQNALVKLMYSPDKAHELALTFDYSQSKANTRLLSDMTSVVSGSRVLDSEGRDEQVRKRVLLNYRYQADDSWLDRFQLDLFTQSSDTEQHSNFLRAPLSDIGLTNYRVRDSEFLQQSTGLNIQFDRQFQGLGSHYLIWGLQWQQTDSEALRTGSTTDLQSGQRLREFSPFPTRDFPISELVESAIFVQDEIQFFDGKLLLSPGVRYDRFELRPEYDDIFVSANPGVAITPFDDSQLSKKLGVIYQLSNEWSLWAQYAEGFRIPPMDDVNVGFTNFLGGYTSLANPELKPESVDSVELGIRASTDAFNINLSAYQNDYEHFIESLAVLGFNRTTNLLEFQARNIEAVEISGLDAQLQWFVGESIEGGEDWIVNLAASIQDSEDKATGQVLDSILPEQYVLGVQYRTYDDPWRVELAVTHSKEAEVIDSEANLFQAPRYTLLDVLAHYDISESLRLNLALYNLLDKKYWLASEVRGRSQDENLARFTSPGRSLAVNLHMKF